MTRAKLKTARPVRPPPNAFRKLTPSPTAVEDAVAKIPQPAPLPKNDAETDAVLARVAPSANRRTTWRASMRADLRQLKLDLLWIWAKLIHLAGLIVYSLNVVLSHVLAAMLYGISLVVFVLTIWEMWTPAKTIADHAMGYLVLVIG
jgi:hypothetical protein